MNRIVLNASLPTKDAGSIGELTLSKSLIIQDAPNGDVELVLVKKGEDLHKPLVIPKELRAEVAAFLVGQRKSD